MDKMYSCLDSLRVLMAFLKMPVRASMLFWVSQIWGHIDTHAHTHTQKHNIPCTYCGSRMLHMVGCIDRYLHYLHIHFVWDQGLSVHVNRKYITKEYVFMLPQCLYIVDSWTCWMDWSLPSVSSVEINCCMSAILIYFPWVISFSDRDVNRSKRHYTT